LIHSRAGIIASGTATVEAALMKTPFVMVYRVSKLTYLLGKPRIKVPYFAMVNLIAGEEVVPELVQDEFTTKNVAERTREIMGDGPVRERMVNKLAKVKEMLIAGSLPHDSAPGQPSTEGSTPPERAAKEILALQHS
jgi:lipid-A-disaccharide synthase